MVAEAKPIKTAAMDGVRRRLRKSLLADKANAIADTKAAKYSFLHMFAFASIVSSELNFRPETKPWMKPNVAVIVRPPQTEPVGKRINALDH
jgi:hypothetical protein